LNINNKSLLNLSKVLREVSESVALSQDNRRVRLLRMAQPLPVMGLCSSITHIERTLCSRRTNVNPLLSSAGHPSGTTVDADTWPARGRLSTAIAAARRWWSGPRQQLVDLELGTAARAARTAGEGEE
jgi:hypothetical protein